MQTALTKIWTWIGKSVSYNDNHYAMSAGGSVLFPWRGEVSIFLCKKRSYILLLVFKEKRKKKMSNTFLCHKVALCRCNGFFSRAVWHSCQMVLKVNDRFYAGWLLASAGPSLGGLWNQWQHSIALDL